MTVIYIIPFIFEPIVNICGPFLTGCALYIHLNCIFLYVYRCDLLTWRKWLATFKVKKSTHYQYQCSDDHWKIQILRLINGSLSNIYITNPTFHIFLNSNNWHTIWNWVYKTNLSYIPQKQQLAQQLELGVPYTFTFLSFFFLCFSLRPTKLAQKNFQIKEVNPLPILV